MLAVVNVKCSAEKGLVRHFPQGYRNESQRPLTSLPAHSPLVKLLRSQVGYRDEVQSAVGISKLGVFE